MNHLVESMIDLMVKLNYGLPRLIISVTGGARDFELSKELQTVLRRGLRKVCLGMQPQMKLNGYVNESRLLRLLTLGSSPAALTGFSFFHFFFFPKKNNLTITIIF